MSGKIIFRLLITLAVTLVLSLAVAFPGTAAASQLARIRVSGPDSAVQPGQQFTVNIVVEPNNSIAGLQFNLSFNPGAATVVGVQEGDLLTQNGASSYFGTGAINNTAGTITGVFGVIISPGQSVATAGTFATITMTARSGTGSCPFTLSNVIIGDMAAQALPVEMVNETVSINTGSGNGGSRGTTSGGGGGGGGGGGASGITSLMGNITSEGKVVIGVTAADADQKVKLIIPTGTIATNYYGQAPSSIIIKPSTNSQADNPDSQPVSSVYSIQPGGVTFSPPATMVFSYAGLTLPEVSENSLFIAVWDPDSWTWIDLGGSVDTAARTVSAEIPHLSNYMLMAHTRPAIFEVSNLALTPGEVVPGETVTASLTLTNSGDLSGACKIGLTVDDAATETKSITLAGGVSETVTFAITTGDAGPHRVSIGDASATFLVKTPPAPASFTVSGLTVDPISVDPGEDVDVTVVVTNSADLPGTYQAVLEVDGAAVSAKEINLAGGESLPVAFKITPEGAGIHRVSIGGLLAPFEVISPPPPVPLVLTPALAVDSFSASPSYDGATDRFVSARISYTLNQAWDTILDSRLLLTVFHDGQLLEQVPLLMQPDSAAGEMDYIPSAGWDAGEYAFRAELYEGESLVQDTPFEILNVTPESMAAVISWKTLGIIVGSSLALGLTIVTLVLYFRRDTMRDYWR